MSAGEQRWLSAKSSITVPAFSLVKPSGGSKGDSLDIAKPVTADKNYYGATGPTEINSTTRGQVTWDFPAWVKYTGTAPAVDAEVGLAANSFEVKTGQKGYKVLLVDTGEGLCLITPFKDASGGADPFDTEQTVLFKVQEESGGPYYFWVEDTADTVGDMLYAIWAGNNFQHSMGGHTESGAWIDLDIAGGGGPEWVLTTPDGVGTPVGLGNVCSDGTTGWEITDIMVVKTDGDGNDSPAFPTDNPPPSW